MSKTRKEMVLVTGASSGIGRELARCFAESAGGLILVARREERLRQLATEIEDEYAIAVHVMPADLSSPGACGELAERLAAASLDVDVLVNNAGLGDQGAFPSDGLGRQLAMIDVNIRALTELTGLLLPAMKQRNHGAILNVGSIAGFQPGPFMAVYFASKAYVLSFSEALAEELCDTSISVSVLAPGPVETEFIELAGMDVGRLREAGFMSAEQVARAGHDGLRKGRTIVIPGLLNKAGVASVRFVPRLVVRKIVRALQGAVAESSRR